jgi:BirA family biotin operon repressor/biotin-[acetyl-CoA-carboxylase] ligase
MIGARIAPDLARIAEVIAAKGCRLGKPVHLLAETGSTNDDAKAGAREGAPHGALWLAETQSRGRGRQGRTWISPPGENLLFSVLLRIACAPARVPSLSLVCGLAVRDAVAKALGDDARVLVKWPNDVVVRGRDGSVRKIAGILVESALAGGKVEHIVVGIGLNVHTRDFPAELEAIATSVVREGAGGREGPKLPDRAEILADVLAALDHDLEHVAQRGLGLVHGRLTAHDALAGSEVESDDGGVSGVACGIDPDGRLLVRRATDGRVTKVASGEVRWRRAGPANAARPR